MKKYFYIAMFMLLGFLLQLLLHVTVESIYIKLLVSNFSRYGLGMTWDSWFLIHHVLSYVLTGVGVLIGYHQGEYWWKVIYIQKKYSQWTHVK